MLTERHESKSIRVNSVNDDGSEVLSSGASFGDTNITISFDMLDSAYCANHPDEVQNAMTAFLARLNAALSADELPQVLSK